MEHVSPGKTIRRHCLDCVENFKEVINCQGDKQFLGPCFFYKYRLGKGRTSVKTIRKFCLQCMCNSSLSVQNCQSRTCKLMPFRLGKNPAIKNRVPSTEGRRFKRLERAPETRTEAPGSIKNEKRHSDMPGGVFEAN